MPSPDCLACTLLTDSAVVRPRTPLFLPDFAAEGWTLEVVPVAVVSRLGKWIEPRFARRYCEKAGVAVRLVPEEGLPANAFAANFDGAFAPCGEMTDLPAAEEPWQLSCGDVAVEISPGQLHLDDSLALCSRYMMLKTGDMIVPCRTGLRIAPRVGDTVATSLNGHELLKLKIR